MNKNDKNFFLFLFLIHIFFIQNIYSSMFPNVYQFKTSKTEIKTRSINEYNMCLVDAQMAVPLKEDQNTISVYTVGIYTQSLAQKNENFGCGFSINRKNEMKVIGDQIINEIPSRDIRAEYVDGSPDTNAKIALSASQRYIGTKILVQCSLEKILKNCFFKDWFFSLRTSIVNVEQQLRMTLTGSPKYALEDIKNFFSSKTPYAKIDNTIRTNTGFENITLSIDGIYKNHNKTIQIYYYSGIEIPTTLTESTPYLFYPTIGNNGAIGFLLGADFHGYFYQKNNHEFGFLLEIENHFLFYKTTKRVFDLFTQNDSYYSQNAINSNNKPWSRYLPSYSFKYPQNKTNVSLSSNLPVRVHPCNNLDISIGGIYYILTNTQTKWYFAAGYNLWMAQPDYLELQDRVYPKEYQNFYQYGIIGSLPNTTSSQSTIQTQASNDTFLEHFTFNSLDCGSAAADGSYSQLVFLRGTAIACSGWTAMLGGWYEVGKPKMAPSRGGGWIGCGYEF